MVQEGPPPDGGSATPDADTRRAGGRERIGRGRDRMVRAARTAGGATGRAAGYTYRQARRATHAQGAGETGLSRLIELQAVHAAGDAAVAIALAGTLFFQVPAGEARDQVALFLVLTMLPFAIVAPLVGPLLDRFGHGRRWAIGSTTALRAFLAWVLADAVTSGSMALFPAALGTLVASKAYNVTRAAAVPRVLPETLTLVRANSRMGLAGVAGATVSAPLAVLAASFGSEWTLRYAFLVFVWATVLAILLPARVDSAAGEEPVALTRLGRAVRRRTAPHVPPRARRRARVPPRVVLALRCNAGLRVLSGALTIYLAFLLREHPFPGWEDRPELLLGLVVGAAGAGNTLGIGLGSVLRGVRPDLTVVLTLLAATLMTVLTTLFYGLVTAVLLGLVAGTMQGLGKVSLDALLQRGIHERTRASAFARAETLLQLSWVVGGFIGIAVPLVPELGLGIISGVLVVWSAFVVLAQRARHRRAGPGSGARSGARSRGRTPGPAEGSAGR